MRLLKEKVAQEGIGCTDHREDQDKKNPRQELAGEASGMAKSGEGLGDAVGMLGWVLGLGTLPLCARR